MNTITNDLRLMIYASLFAALIAAGAFISVPIGPVPIVLQNMFVLLAGLFLGWKWGLASVSIYIFAGILGLPVFSSGGGGIGHVMGPTGGYLLSYIPAVILVGIVSNQPSLRESKEENRRLFPDLIAMVLGSSVVYCGGVPWLKIVTGMSWDKAIAIGMVPFIIGDFIKIAAAVPIVRTLRPLMIKTTED